MDTLGTDFNNTGSVMSRSQLEDLRRKRGECVRCGRKCFRKKLFKMIPITEPGLVFEGRCLRCKPLNNTDDDSGPPSMHRQTTPLDRQRFERSQSNLSSRNLDISGMSSFSNLSGRRPISRTHSAQQRSDNRSVGSSSTSSRPHLAGRKPRESPHSAPVRPPQSLNSTGGEENQASRLRLNITSLSEADVADDDEISLTDFQTNSSHRERSIFAQSHSAIQSQSSAIPEMRSTSAHRERTCFTPTARRASHSDAQLRSDTLRALSYERPSNPIVPTPEELQRAAMTILVAKQSGIYEDVFPAASDYSAFNDQLETLSTDRDMQDGGYDDLPIGFQHRGSHRSLRSGSSRETPKPIDEIDGYEYPSHGILNRGGTFPISPAMNGGGRPVVGGSSRTLSSMSSLEEDMQLPAGVTNSMRGIAVEALYEESDDHSALSGNSSREQMEREALRQLGNGGELLSDQEYILKLRQVENDFGEILIILREAITSSIVVRYGLEDLASVQLTQEDHEVLADMGAPNVIAEVMEAHHNSLAVQLWGCGAIWNMSGTTRNQLAFVDAGALDVILAAMDTFVESVELQEKAIATLSNLGAAENNLSFLCDQGAVSGIVKAMNTHSEVATVQIRGCAAVTNLASHDTPLKQHIVECGAGGAVVVAMVMHPNDSYLQEKALRALRNLCANSEVNKVELANIGGIDAVISAMQVHRDEAGVQEEGAWTLSNLAGNDGNKAVIGDCGGIDVVIRAMWVHSDHVGVQEWCCRALFTLTLDPHNGDIVLMVGGISAIVNTMQAHGDSPTVQEMGCAVLGNLASTDQSRMRIVDEEALDAIVLAMVLHADDIQVQEQACMVLLRLTIDPNRQSMQAANIPELVRTAAQKFPERCTEAAEQLLQAFGTHI